jgi:PAS domain-containing protein
MRKIVPLDLVETVREGILVLEPDLTIRFANRSFCHTFEVAPAELENDRMASQLAFSWN